MKNLHPSNKSADHTECATGSERKPFEAPQLRREAALTQATAERSFTFSASGGS